MNEPENDQWPSELTLDDEPGPASYQSAAARDAMLRDVLDRAYPKKRATTRWVAAAALIACIGGGSASAAVLWYVRSQQPPAEVPVHQPVTPKRVEAMPEVQPLPPVVQEEAPQPVQRPAEDWLREGNRLRAARRWKQADEAYGNAARDVDSAYVAFVASAGVRLEHLHDARGALSRYRAALHASPKGALSEEIRMGIADAYQALGDRGREREALETFLREHPDSPLAEQARSRLR